MSLFESVCVLHTSTIMKNAVMKSTSPHTVCVDPAIFLEAHISPAKYKTLPKGLT